MRVSKTQAWRNTHRQRHFVSKTGRLYAAIAAPALLQASDLAVKLLYAIEIEILVLAIVAGVAWLGIELALRLIARSARRNDEKQGSE